MSAQDYLDEFKEDKGTDMNAQEIVNMASRKKVIIRKPSRYTGAVNTARTIGKVSGRIFNNITSSASKTANAIARPYGNSKPPQSIFNPLTGGMMSYGGENKPKKHKVSHNKYKTYVIIGGKKYVRSSKSKSRRRKKHYTERNDYDRDRGFNPIWGN